MHRKDRSIGTEGYGGVLAWVANSIICKRRKDLETDELEAMWLELRPMNQKFFLCVVYRPPNSALCFCDDLQKSIETIQSNYNSRVMLIGDLNADFRTRPGKALLNSVERNNLRIHNREPTRITDHHSAIVLDQCISIFFSNLVSNTEILPPVASSDHYVLVVN